MLPKPRAHLKPNTADFERFPLVKPTGFREYDARWLFPEEINLMPEGAEEGIIKGMHLIRAADPKSKGRRVQLMGCGAILREVIAGADLLEKDFGISADIWSVTSFTELKREAHDCERWNMPEI